MPEIVVGVVAYCVLPEGDSAFVEFGFNVCDSSEVEEELVGIAVEVDLNSFTRGFTGLWPRDAEPAVERDEVLKHECSVVVEVVAEEPICGWSLW